MVARVLCIFGSESGTAERGIRRWVKKWQSRENLNFEVCEIASGNAICKRLGGESEANPKNLEYLLSEFKYDENPGEEATAIRPPTSTTSST